MKHKQIFVILNRRILQNPVEEGDLRGPSGLSLDPIFTSKNGSSPETSLKRNYSSIWQLQHTTPFDSSVALTILVLLSALFFIGFFAIYIFRFSEDDGSTNRRRRNLSLPPAAGAASAVSQKRGGGVDSSTIEALPRVSYRVGAKQLISDCPICLSEFEEGEIVKMIPHCRHVFHTHCLDTWLTSHVSCPLCRGTQFFKAAEDEEVRLDVREDEDSNSAGESGGRSTLGDCDMWSGAGLRRACSCTSLGNRQTLHRSMSF